MFGIFDLKYHEPWSKHISRQYMIEAGFSYSLEPIGRDKCCFEKIVKLGKRNAIKLMNNRSTLMHGYTIHCTLKKEAGGIVKPNFRRKPEIFYMGFLHRAKDITTTKDYECTPSLPTTVEQKEEIQRRVQKYHNDNAMTKRHLEVDYSWVYQRDVLPLNKETYSHIEQNINTPGSLVTNHNILRNDKPCASTYNDDELDFNWDEIPSRTIPNAIQDIMDDSISRRNMLQNGDKAVTQGQNSILLTIVIKK